MGKDSNLIALVSSFLGPAAAASATDAAADAQISAIPSKHSSVDDDATIDAVAVAASGDVTKACVKYQKLSARVVILSKDRPWQLKQLMRSMKLVERGSNSNDMMSSLLRTLEIYIILRASTPSFTRGYERLMEEYEDMAHFLIENDLSEETTFSSLLQQALTIDIDGGEHSNDGIVMFLTDDCLILEPLESILVCAAGAIATNPLVFNFISRLHQGITWSQTRGVASPPPWNELKYHSLSGYLRDLTTREGDGEGDGYHHEGVYVYNRKCCSGEWSYPFDLSGGIYRHGDVLALLSHMDAEQRSHPNILELMANKLLEGASANNDSVYENLGEPQKPLSAIPTRPLLVILAINRVQDVFQAPLATPQHSQNHAIHNGANEYPMSDTMTADPSDPASLLGLLDIDCLLDIDRYKSTFYNSTHIGDFFITSKRGNECKELENSTSKPSHPKISVLIPVHRGPPDAASHCIVSVIMQLIDEYNEFRSIWEGNNSCFQDAYQNRALSSPMQIVLVDDRCDDGSIDAMIRSSHEVLKSYEKDISYAIRDHRTDRAPETKCSNTRNRCISICLDIVRSPKAGIACALNHGLSYCSANFVARMDADDICAPKRLSSQIEFMHANPTFTVVGTSAVLFSTEMNYCPDTTLPYTRLMENLEPCSVLRPSLSISDPGFMAWTMHFSCTISHPTVVFQKDTILELAGYDESISCSEDYDLWLRLLGRCSRSMISLPYIGLWHRKHNKSISSARALTQKSEADEACFRAMQRLFHSSNDHAQLDIEHVRTLRNPSSALSSTSLDFAAELLVRLESSFLHVHSEHLTPQEIMMINMDCSARIGEIATILVTKLGNGSISHLDGGDVSKCVAWQIWCDRCPLEQLKRLCLICQLNNMSVK